MSKLTIHYIPTERLTENPGQAQTRYNDASYGRLKKDIAEHGILDPLDVHKNGEIEDGHRRWRIAKELGIAEVPVIYTEAKDWMVRKNSQQRPMRGIEFLYGYLNDRGLPDKTVGAQIKRLEQLGGSALLERLYAQKMSPSVWGTVTLAAHHCGVDLKDLDTVRIIVGYLIQGRRQAIVKAAIRGGISSEALWEAIQENRDPVQRWG